MTIETKEGDLREVPHDEFIKLQNDMTWVKKRLDSQSTQLWGMTIGIVFVLLKVLLS